MRPTIYQIKSGRYTGLWHARLYKGNGRYFHIGRFKNKAEAEEAMRRV